MKSAYFETNVAVFGSLGQLIVIVGSSRFINERRFLFPSFLATTMLLLTRAVALNKC